MHTYSNWNPCTASGMAMFTLYVNHSSGFSGRTTTTTTRVAGAGAATGCGCAVGGQRYATAEGAVKAFCVNAINVEINSTTEAATISTPSLPFLLLYGYPNSSSDIVWCWHCWWLLASRGGKDVAVLCLYSGPTPSGWTFTYAFADTAGERAGYEGCHQKVSIAKLRRNYEIFY